MIVYVGIGNSDDKLSQREWSELVDQVDRTTRSGKVHGAWFSAPNAPYQNACWCIEFDPDAQLVNAAGETLRRVDHIRGRLRRIAAEYRQDSIAWTEATATEFLGATHDAA